MKNYKIRITIWMNTSIGGRDTPSSQWQIWSPLETRAPFGTHRLEGFFFTPCNSKINKFLVQLLLDGNSEYQGTIDVTPEEAKILDIIFDNHRRKSLWSEGMRILKKHGKQKTWEWLKEKAAILKLCHELEGEKE